MPRLRQGRRAEPPPDVRRALRLEHDDVPEGVVEVAAPAGGAGADLGTEVGRR